MLSKWDFVLLLLESGTPYFFFMQHILDIGHTFGTSDDMGRFDVVHVAHTEPSVELSRT
jgi:hypothetical protein